MKLYARLLKFIKPYYSQIIGGTICTALVTSTTLLIAPLVGYIFQLIEDKNMFLLNLSALGMIGLFVLKGLFQYGQEYLSYFVAQRIIVDLRNQVYEHLQDLSLDFYAKWNTGELVSRVMNDIQTLQATLFTGFVTLIPHSLLLLGLMGYIFWLNWQLSLLTLVALPLIVQVIRIFAKEIREISEGVQQKAADITSHLQETISQVKTVKSFAMEKEELAKFKGKTEKSFDISMRAVQILATQNPVIALLQTIAVVGIVWFGGREIISGSLSLPQLISFATALGIMTDPGNTLSKAYSIIQQGMASTKRIFEVLDVKPSIADLPGAKKLPRINGEINFENISFAYENEEVLQNINLKVKPGEIIALVGRTGAGKSTLTSLLLRFYDPTSGRILVDGQDIKTAKLESLRKQIAVVPQEIALFSGTIKDNIAYGRPNASEAEIIEAAKFANIHDFINSLPKKYETQVAERGSRLSGGERQRVAIARAILRDPRILILDEATSSLDAETESLIRDALERLMKGRTTFIIAHRLYAVEHANRIVVIDNKQILEIGSHQELLQKDGLYKYLYAIQFNNKA
ncbi:ABC transporter ATP-binding protein [Candidatus Saganbacteria bacterium CG08_land_8_20_14_0_20_45_16]|uniref:ABC transporter ATP-binding protein n=1 Tax=Candidatus Saganbacteria bacterium CG08_land_8_20_14_0_20_45_16 TaxID=2014293 RepID=A0A2H0Y1Z2_UNCSA|nr:MAG: ABC transporter ATP-binding protein [Candidatus Saganbacteria bacterium CG08_land_8_20_14_0_20_45_16]